MKRTIQIMAFLMLLLPMQSCWWLWGNNQDDTIWVYKTKADYSDKVTVELSEDKTRITSFYGPSGVSFKWPQKLTDGFFLNGTMGVNSGILSITKEDYEQMELGINLDSMYNLLIDKDPFLEFYQYEGNEFWVENGFDTVRINNLIKNNQLEKYFAKLK